jgi:hypothetical protein
MDRPSCIQGTVEHAFEQHVELKWKDTLNMAAAESVVCSLTSFLRRHIFFVPMMVALMT